MEKFGNPEQQRPERKIPIEQIRELTIGALEASHLMHETLGASGEETVQKNQFGETALKVDVECEEAILNALRQAGLPIKVVSEEHGTVGLSDNPQYLGILDGLDGTSVYKKERGTGRYGTMFGIFDTENPRYNDYIASGIMEHSTGRLFVASRGEGAFVIEKGIKKPIKTSELKTLEKDAKIYIDEYFDINRETFSEKLDGFEKKYLGSSAVYYADVASGAADLALECTRKGNLEIAVAYGLIKEAGGVVVDLDGNDIGVKKYLDYGQDQHVPVITAANADLANDLLRHLKS